MRQRAVVFSPDIPARDKESQCFVGFVFFSQTIQLLTSADHHCTQGQVATTTVLPRDRHVLAD